MRRVLARVIYGVALVALAISFVGGRRATSDVHAESFVLPEGIPITLYEPGAPRDWGTPPPEDSLPTVVLAHGYASSRGIMSTLARRLARGGYAVVTFDFRGHGANPAPLRRLREGRGGLVEDLDVVITYVRAHPRLDGTRIALAGHSMGGGAAMRYASFESGLGCVIGISGGTSPEGPYPVQNLLLVWAEGDPDAIRLRMRDLGARQSNLERLVLDRTYGDVARGEGLHLTEVAGANHTTIVFSGAATRRILDWLRQTIGPGVAARLDPLTPGAGAWVALGVLATLVLLWGLPQALAPVFGTARSAAVVHPVRGGLWFVASIAGAIALLYPTAAYLGAGPAGLLPLGSSRQLTALLAIAGALYWVAIARSGAAPPAGRPLSRDVAAAVLLFAASYLMLGGAIAPYLELGLEPRRLAWAAVSALLVLPFFLTAERALRGTGALGTWLPVAAKLVLVVSIGIASFTGVLPYVLSLALGGVAAVLVLVELVAQSAVRAGIAPRASALYHALWIGQVTAGFPFVVG